MRQEKEENKVAQMEKDLRGGIGPTTTPKRIGERRREVRGSESTKSGVSSGKRPSVMRVTVWVGDDRM
jgi:hypothetical protein